MTECASREARRIRAAVWLCNRCELTRCSLGVTRAKARVEQTCWRAVTVKVVVSHFVKRVKEEDLGLSDTELGFLTGIAFGLFYAVVGLPIARRAQGTRACVRGAKA